MKEIVLTNGMKCLVDDDCFDELSKFNWYAEKGTRTFHVHRTFYLKGKKTKIYLHRLIIDAKKGFEVDHIDGNGLNNQRSNLRLCTHKQNCSNRPSIRNSSSRYLGVAWYKKTNKWRVQIEEGDKGYHIGYYESEKEAALAYNVTASFMFREFARLNVV